MALLSFITQRLADEDCYMMYLLLLLLSSSSSYLPSDLSLNHVHCECERSSFFSVSWPRRLHLIPFFASNMYDILALPLLLFLFAAFAGRDVRKR